VNADVGVYTKTRIHRKTSRQMQETYQEGARFLHLA